MSQDKQELLKAVSKILDEALLTYEEIEKSEVKKSFDNTEEVQDPSRASSPELQKEEAPPFMAEGKKDEPESEEEEEESEEDKKKKKDAEGEESEEKEEKPEEDEDDEKMMEAYKSMTSKMEKRGLIKKSETAQPETKVEEVKKSEDSKAEIETLKKSFSEQVDGMKAQMDALTKAVEKFAKAPAAPRKGLSGATPLRKSGDGEDKPVLTKSGALNKLLDLRKSGDNRVDTGLINRVETGRLTKQDYEKLNSILG